MGPLVTAAAAALAVAAGSDARYWQSLVCFFCFAKKLKPCQARLLSAICCTEALSGYSPHLSRTCRQQQLTCRTRRQLNFVQNCIVACRSCIVACRSHIGRCIRSNGQNHWNSRRGNDRYSWAPAGAGTSCSTSCCHACCVASAAGGELVGGLQHPPADHAMRVLLDDLLRPVVKVAVVHGCRNCSETKNTTTQLQFR